MIASSARPRCCPSHRHAPGTLALTAAPLLAQEARGRPARSNLLAPSAGLMFWTLIIFVDPARRAREVRLQAAPRRVEAREQALEDAIEGAKRDRDAAAELLAQQRAQLEAGRAEAQQLHRRRRAAAEKMRADMLEQTQVAAGAMLERARREIEGEKRAADRRAAPRGRRPRDRRRVRVIEQNLDDASNRRSSRIPRSLDAAEGREVVSTRESATIARNYAEALLALARKAERRAGLGQHARARSPTAIEQDATLRGFLESPRISADQQEDVLVARRSATACRASSCASCRRW